MKAILSVRTGRLAELDVWGELCAQLRQDSVIIPKYLDQSTGSADIECLMGTLSHNQGTRRNVTRHGLLGHASTGRPPPQAPDTLA